MKAKQTHKFLKVILIILAIPVTLLMLLTLIHQIGCLVEGRKNPPIGTLVEVDGHNMSVMIQGTGEETIVLLPGLGTTAPILDFAPLADALSDTYQVITVEPFGYGWSELTDSPRTITNQVEELHEALKKLGLTKPYLLMGHSISGLNALYYIHEYPDEVSAFIGIDCTLPTMPDYFEEELPPVLPSSIGYLRHLGLMRVLTKLSPESFLSNNAANAYSQQNLSMQKLLSYRIAQNENMIDQNNHIAESIALTKDLSFPKELPTIFFTCESENHLSKQFYETYLTNPAIQTVCVLDASHYMHDTKAKEMSSFLKDYLIFQK